MTTFRRVRRVPCVRLAVEAVPTIRAAVVQSRPVQSNPRPQRTAL
jgi:hypothetical protein